MTEEKKRNKLVELLRGKGVIVDASGDDVRIDRYQEIVMKYEDKTTQQDEKDRIIRIEMTAENREENKMLAKGMGIEIDEPNYIECTIDLKKEE